MTYYWFAKNIPELHEVQPVDRREWLRVARQRSARRSSWLSRVALALVIPMALICTRELACWGYFSRLAGLLVVFVVSGMAALIHDVVWSQPRARQWLREHLHEFRIDDPPMNVARP